MTARLTGLFALLAIALAVAPAAAPAAVPANVKRVLADYRNDGRIDACRHSAKDLRDTLKAVSADTEQYAPDFPAAIEAAIEARARGECDEKKKPKPDGGAGAAPAPPPAAPPASPPPAQPLPQSAAALPTPSGDTVAEPPAPPGSGAAITPGTPPPADNKPNVVMTRPAVAPGSGDAPVALLVLAALLGACLLAGLAMLAIRRLGWGEERLAGVRHAWAEAGYRTGGTWQDFTDWVRLGR